MPTEVVRVTPAQVALAQLQMDLDEAAGRPVDPEVRRIAEAKHLADLVAQGVEIIDVTPSALQPSGDDMATSSDPRIVEEGDAARRADTAKRRVRDIFRVPDGATLITVTPRWEHSDRRVLAEDDARTEEIITALLPQSEEAQQERHASDRMDQGDRKENLILIGGDPGNEITHEVLQHENTQALLDIGFRAGPVIRLEGEEFGDEQARARALPGQRVDFGLLAKLPNPYNPTATVLIVAGVHALGTLGAAEYLRWHVDNLEAQIGEDYFAVVVLAVQDDPGKQPEKVDIQPIRGPIHIIGAPEKSPRRYPQPAPSGVFHPRGQPGQE